MAEAGRTKLGIVGAGAVGTSLAYAALIRGSADAVVYDLNAARAEAQVLDLAHSTPFAHAVRVIGGGDVWVLADSDVIAITGLDRGRVMGSGTTLDSARLRWLVAERAGVAPRNAHAVILGEHGDSEFPLWSDAMVGGSSVSAQCCGHGGGSGADRPTYGSFLRLF